MTTTTKLSDKPTQMEVLAAVAEELPDLHQHLEIERAWVWYCGPSLKEDGDARKKLGAMGFRYAAKGHPMASGKTGSWAHHCQKPIPRKRSGSKPSPNAKPRPKEREAISDLDAAILEMIGA